MSFFTSWQLPCIIILLTAGEAIFVWLYHRKTGGGIAMKNFLPILLAGDFLMFALAVALARGWGGWIALALLASLCCHVMDLVQRWQRS
jgi:hypothetical protein